MKIAILQQDIIWGDIQANCEAAAKAIDAQPGNNLYILPEMCFFFTKMRSVYLTD